MIIHGLAKLPLFFLTHNIPIFLTQISQRGRRE